MATVLLVHHTVSPATAAVYQAAKDGLGVPELGELTVESAAALTAGPASVLDCAAVLLLTPVNIGYLSGAMKHFFDQIYYPCLEQTRGLPFGAVLHSGSDASGALRALAAITGGLGWRPVADPLVLAGDPDAAARQQISELAGTVGAHAAGLI
jgi:NAD(P)H-dependent FMN reductase